MSEVFLPVLPAVVGQVVQAAADPDVSVAALAQLIDKDPVFATQLLKAVNSPFYGPRCSIATVQRAVAFMGIRAARNLVLSLGVRSLSPDVQGFPLELFWEASLRRAAAAMCLARRLRASGVEELFAIGLCQDLGLLLQVVQHKELVRELAPLLRQPAPLRLTIEERYGVPHPEHGAQLFESWGFPEEICGVVRYHHSPADAPPALVQAASAALAAETISDVGIVDDKQVALHAAQQQLRQIGLDPNDLVGLLDEVNAKVVSAAEMLQLRVSKQPTYHEIAVAAAQGLLDLNLSYQDLNDRLRSALEEQNRLAAQLQLKNEELKELASTDQLTGLANRRAFDEGLTRELAQADRQGKPLSLLLLDIDHFKRFNDTHGHQAGDHLLRQLGQLLRQKVRASDLPARYGGEEFAIVLPFTPEAGARIVAERVRCAVAESAFGWESDTLQATVSVGGTTMTPPLDRRAAVLTVRQADDALYAAKDGGRNRVCWS